MDRTKLDRTCPRCRAHRYHFARCELVAKRAGLLAGVRRVDITCAECGHKWRGRYRTDEWT